MTTRYLSVADVAQHFRKSQKTIREWCRKSEQTGVPFEGVIKYPSNSKQSHWYIPEEAVYQARTRKAVSQPYPENLDQLMDMALAKAA